MKMSQETRSAPATNGRGNMNRFKIAFLLLLTLSMPQQGIAMAWQQPPEEAPHDDEVALLLKLNKEIKPIEAIEIQGSKKYMVNIVGHKALVVVFLDFRCPISNRMIPVLNDLTARYTGLDVAFAGVVCGGVTFDELVVKKKEYRIQFDLFHDPKLAIANHFRATTTPQAFVIDKQRVIRYIGAINDQNPDRTTRLAAPTKNYLEDCLDQVLKNRPVDPANTRAVGCPIARASKPVLETGAVTFHKHVEPLLQRHCQKCHHPEDVAPFSLLTFEDAFNWADDIKDFVSTRRMPPWHVTGGVPLRNDPSLKPEEIATITRWVDEGCPKGDPKDSPKPITFKSRQEWNDPTPPDLVLKLPEAFHLAARGEDHYRTVVFPLGNQEEKYVRRTEFIPGNKKIVHHSMTFYDGTGLVLEAQKRLGKPKPFGTGDEDYGPGYESGMGLGFVPNPEAVKRNKNNPGALLHAWVPGGETQEPPAGARNLIPPDSSILMQIHYHRTGKPEVDESSRLAVWFDREKPKQYLIPHMVDTSFRLIPKGVENFRSSGSKVIPSDCHLWLFGAHMHMVGKEFRAWHQPKNSTERRLIFELKNWDFNWQSRYSLKEPILLEKGSTIHVEAIFDNSAKNPNNPFSPPRTIFLGENTTDEMAFLAMSTFRDTPPEPSRDFLNYFVKLTEAEALKKLLSGKASP
jgi:peroxiredoxin